MKWSKSDEDIMRGDIGEVVRLEGNRLSIQWPQGGARLLQGECVSTVTVSKMTASPASKMTASPGWKIDHVTSVSSGFTPANVTGVLVATLKDIGV